MESYQNEEFIQASSLKEVIRVAPYQSYEVTYAELRAKIPTITLGAWELYTLIRYLCKREKSDSITFPAQYFMVSCSVTKPTFLKTRKILLDCKLLTIGAGAFMQPTNYYPTSPPIKSTRMLRMPWALVNYLRELYQNERVSTRQRYLLLYLFSFFYHQYCPASFVLSQAHLQNQVGGSLRGLKNDIKRLQDLGFVKYTSPKTPRNSAVILFVPSSLEYEKITQKQCDLPSPQPIKTTPQSSSSKDSPSCPPAIVNGQEISPSDWKKMYARLTA